MNQRTIEMVQLLSKEKDEIAVSGFAEYFYVSQKTIRNDIKAINDLLRSNKKKEIVINPGGRISLPDDFDEAVSLLTEGDFYSYRLSKGERKQAAAAMIVNSADYITLATIADHLFVSRATIINDLKDIKAYIKEQDMEVSSHANKGLRIEGPESKKREFLYRIIRPSSDGVQSDVVSRHISVQAGDRSVIQKILAEQEARYQKQLDDESFRDLVLYLRIMVNRNSAGEFLESQPDPTGEYYMFALDILKSISQYCDVTTTEEDVRHLCGFMEGMHFVRSKTAGESTAKIQMITRQFISGISAELGINLNTDYDFFENLSNHLGSVLSAPPQEYPDLDVVNEIIEENQDVLDAVISQLDLIYQYTGRSLNNTEIDYIVVHVCAAIERKRNKEISFRVIVACHAGIGTSKLLLEKLKRHFRFRIVDVISAHECVRIDPNSADFVISTVPLDGCPIEYVVVSVAFNDADYIKVGGRIDALRASRNLPADMEEDGLNARDLIEKIKPLVYGSFDQDEEKAKALMKELRGVIRDYFKQSAASEGEIVAPYLHHLLSPAHIELDVECADWKDAVRKSAVKLLEQGYIEESYIDAMIYNIEEYGPYIVLSEGFAMPHAKVEEGSIRLGMHLIRLKNPVSFGIEELDPIYYVCCLSVVDHRTYLKAFFNLVNLMKDDEFRRRLDETQSPEEAAAVIVDYEYSII